MIVLRRTGKRGTMIFVGQVFYRSTTHVRKSRGSSGYLIHFNRLVLPPLVFRLYRLSVELPWLDLLHLAYWRELVLIFDA